MRRPRRGRILAQRCSGILTRSASTSRLFSARSCRRDYGHWHSWRKRVERYGQTETRGGRGIIYGKRGHFPPCNVGRCRGAKCGWPTTARSSCVRTTCSKLLEQRRRHRWCARPGRLAGHGDVGECGRCLKLTLAREGIVHGASISPALSRNLCARAPSLTKAVVFGHGRSFPAISRSTPKWSRLGSRQYVAYTGFTSCTAPRTTPYRRRSTGPCTLRAREQSSVSHLPSARPERGEPETPTRKVKRTKCTALRHRGRHVRCKEEAARGHRGRRPNNVVQKTDSVATGRVHVSHCRRSTALGRRGIAPQDATTSGHWGADRARTHYAPPWSAAHLRRRLMRPRRTARDQLIRRTTRRSPAGRQRARSDHAGQCRADDHATSRHLRPDVPSQARACRSFATRLPEEDTASRSHPFATPRCRQIRQPAVLDFIKDRQGAVKIGLAAMTSQSLRRIDFASPSKTMGMTPWTRGHSPPTTITRFCPKIKDADPNGVMRAPGGDAGNSRGAAPARLERDFVAWATSEPRELAR